MDHVPAGSEALEPLVRKLNPAALLPESWQAGGEQPPLPRATAERVLRAESDGEFFQVDHLDRTYPEKNTLTHRQCQRVTELLAAIFPERVDAEGVSALLGSFSHETVAAAAAAIDDKGYHIWPTPLSEERVEDLRQVLLERTFSDRLTGETRTGAELYRERDTMRGNWWLDDLPGLAATPLFQRLAFDPAILAVAQAALKAPPIHVQTNAWWTFPPEAAPGVDARTSEERNAQRFHQDFEFLNFVKVFIYISDVTEETGPHVYVAGSANDYEEKLAPVSASQRFTDEAIEGAFGRERVVSITGPSGELTFVNTRGYHKGMTARSGYRLLVQLEFASSLYFNPVPPFDRSTVEPEFAPLMASAPRVFLNYRDPADVAAWKAAFDARAQKARSKRGRKKWLNRFKSLFRAR